MLILQRPGTRFFVILGIAGALVLTACEDDEVGFIATGDNAVIRRGVGFAGRFLEDGPDEVEVEIAITNLNQEETLLRLVDGCPVMLRVYQSGIVVWDQRLATFCPQQILNLILDPNETQRFRLESSADQILDAGGEPGQFLITAYVIPTDDPVIEFPIGSVELGIQ